MSSPVLSKTKQCLPLEKSPSRKKWRSGLYKIPTQCFLWHACLENAIPRCRYVSSPVLSKTKQLLIWKRGWVVSKEAHTWELGGSFKNRTERERHVRVFCGAPKDESAPPLHFKELHKSHMKHPGCPKGMDATNYGIVVRKLQQHDLYLCVSALNLSKRTHPPPLSQKSHLTTQCSGRCPKEWILPTMGRLFGNER